MDTQQKFVITINRQFGTNGRQIANQIAQELGVKLVDRQILSSLAENLNMPEDKLQQMERLRSLTQRVTASYGGEGVSHTRSVTSMEDSIIRLEEANEELNRQISILINLRVEIAATIEQVHNENYRLILEKRHLCFESWPQIGEEMGHTDRWAQVKHRMALEVVQQILDRM